MAEAEEEGELVVLHGPPGSEVLVLKRFVDLSKEFASLKQTIVDLKLSDRFAWSVKTADGLRVELGREQNESTWQERISLYLKTYPIVMTQVMKSIQVFDLRYPNGFALKGEPLVKANAAAR